MTIKEILAIARALKYDHNILDSVLKRQSTLANACFIRKSSFPGLLSKIVYLLHEKNHCADANSLEVTMIEVFNIEQNNPEMNETFP